MMNISVSSPQETLYTGTASELCVRTSCGDVKILPGHADYLAEIGKGRLHIRTNDRIISGTTASGILYNHENSISVLLFGTYEIRTENL